MSKIINVQQTVDNILSVPNVQFKLLNKNAEKNTAVLVTPTNDNFERALINIDQNTFSIGIQSPNEDGKIILTLQPITVEFIEVIAFEEVELPGPNPEVVAEKQPNKKNG